jgi:hypothetical protein
MSEKTLQSLVMFADVSDSTRLYEALGDRRAQTIISECLVRMAEICQSYSGVPIKTVGDEIMCRFPGVDQGVLAAQKINQDLEYEPETAQAKLSVRIGMHYGPVVEQKDDLYGDVVNVAARMTSIARGQQIITTQAVVDRLSRQFANMVRFYDKAAVKGKQEEINMYEILWGQADVTGIISRVDFSKNVAFTYLQLKYRDDEIIVKPNDAVLLIGRGKQCNLVVQALLASRTHARLEYRRGKFVLVDQSTNGTFVKTQDGGKVYLKREELPLSGQGVISLGEAIGEQSENLIYFDCR